MGDAVVEAGEEHLLGVFVEGVFVFVAGGIGSGVAEVMPAADGDGGELKSRASAPAEPAVGGVVAGVGGGVGCHRWVSLADGCDCCFEPHDSLFWALLSDVF